MIKATPFICSSYIGKSARQPDVCGNCYRRIDDPCHQPDLPGTEAYRVLVSQVEQLSLVDDLGPIEQPQLSLF